MQAARFVDKHPGFSFSLLFSPAWGDPLDRGTLPARDAMYAPAELLNQLDRSLVTVPVSSTLSRFGLLWQKEPQTIVRRGRRQVSGGYMNGYLSVDWDARKFARPLDAMYDALGRVTSPNLAIVPPFLLPCLFIASVRDDVMGGQIQSANWLPLFDEMRVILQSHIENLVQLWLKGDSSGALAYRSARTMSAAAVTVDEPLLAAWHSVVDVPLTDAFVRAPRLESGMFELLTTASAMLWTHGDTSFLPALGRALLPISRWPAHPHDVAVPASLSTV